MQYTWALMSASMRETYLAHQRRIAYCVCISYRTIGRWYWEAKDETGDFLYSYGDRLQDAGRSTGGGGAVGGDALQPGSV